MVSHQQATPFPPPFSSASTELSETPVRSKNELLDTPAVSRSAFSMNSNGNSLRATHGFPPQILPLRLVQDKTQADESAPGERCDCGNEILL